ncbi:MAG TPA: DNA-deoxyinosine glycosylase [Sphingomicrobium sp.]|nr:DNA-deoxyinosine glycosylase [Sphingomicrobium sp.]
MSVKFGLAPVARADVRLFILGSLPGDASLAARRYYAHPTNQFWRLLGLAIGEELHGLDYDRRLDRLADRRIGLWDVIASARRPGSLDQAIRGADHNAVDRLLHDFPDLRGIAFNGATAAAVGRALIGAPPAHVELIDLPSSSAANTRPFAEKAIAWSRVAQLCAPAQKDRQ